MIDKMSSTVPALPHYRQIERHFRINVVADLAGVSRSTVIRRIADGTISVVRLGARITLVPESEVAKLLGRSSVEANAEVAPSATPGVTVHRIAK